MNFSSFRYILTFLLPLACMVITDSSTCHDHILQIKAPKSLSKLPGLYCYYKGLEYDLSGKWALINDEKPITALSIVITDTIEIPQHQGNCITYLMRGENECSWYDLTQTEDGSWNIEKKDLTDVPQRLPKQTLILFIDPRLVETITQPATTSFAEDTETPETITRLPLIVFKKNLTTEDFKEASDFAILAAVNLKSVHQPASQP